MTKDRLIIFDTTLRDGEQSPGASMTKEEKLRIAKQLERLRRTLLSQIHFGDSRELPALWFEGEHLERR